MAKETKTLSLDEIFARLDETEALKKQAIEQLLEQRGQIDAQLAKLGYTDGQQPLKKKRNRRTKEQIAADKARAAAAGE